MPTTRLSLRAATGLAALVVALPVAAQNAELPALPELAPVGVDAPMAQAELEELPAQYRRLPLDEAVTSTTTDTNGVETITRTRRIVTRAPAVAPTIAPTIAPTYPANAPQPGAQGYYGQGPYAQSAYPAAGYAPMVLDRESWVRECERRTKGRGRDETGSIIGGLLGAVGGGILGNRLWDSERLAGTLIGGGVGGIAGLLIGSLFNDDNKEDRYDCQAALDTYLDQYGENGSRFAARVIPAPAAPVAAYPGYPAYGYNYGQMPAYPYYQSTQTTVMVPVTTYQQQQVVVKETVREEMVEAPGATRSISSPAPRPVPVAPAPSSRSAPSAKMIKN